MSAVLTYIYSILLYIESLGDTVERSVIKPLQVDLSSKLASDHITSTHLPKLPVSLPSHPRETPGVEQENFQEILFIFYAACYQDKPWENLLVL